MDKICTKCNKSKPKSSFLSYKRKNSKSITNQEELLCDACRDTKKEYGFPTMYVGDYDLLNNLGAEEDDYICPMRLNKIIIQTYDMRNKQKIKEFFLRWLDEAY